MPLAGSMHLGSITFTAMRQNHCLLADFSLVSLSQDSSYCLEQHGVSGLAQRGVLDVVDCGH